MKNVSKTFLVYIGLFISLVLISAGSNLLALKLVNTDNSYTQEYEKLTDKGYLTEQEVEQLSNLEREFTSKNNRDKRASYFYSGLLAGLTAVFLIAVAIRIFVGNDLKLILAIGLVFVSYAIGSGSLKQAMSATIVFSLGVFVGNFFKKE